MRLTVKLDISTLVKTWICFVVLCDGTKVCEKIPSDENLFLITKARIFSLNVEGILVPPRTRRRQ